MFSTELLFRYWGVRYSSTYEKDSPPMSACLRFNYCCEVEKIKAIVEFLKMYIFWLKTLRVIKIVYLLLICMKVVFLSNNRKTGKNATSERVAMTINVVLLLLQISIV